MTIRIATSNNTDELMGLTPTTSLAYKTPFAINSGATQPCYLEDNKIKFKPQLTYTTATNVTMTKDLLPIDLSSVSDGTYKIALPKEGNQPYLFGKNTFISSDTPVNATIVGAPTIVGGVASGFSVGNYLKTKFQPQNKNWEILFKYTTASTIAPTQTLCCNNSVPSFGFYPKYNTTTLLNLSSNGTSWNIGSQYGSLSIQANTTYWFKIAYDGTKYTVDYSTDGINFTNDITITSSSSIYQNNQDFNIGIGRLLTGEYINGSVDLKESYIKINDELWWQGTGNIGDVWINPQEPVLVQQKTEDSYTGFDDVILMDSNLNIQGTSVVDFTQPSYRYNGIYAPGVNRLSKPSSKHVDLTLGASGSTYIAPASGYFFLQKMSTSSGQYVSLSNASSNYWTTGNCYAPSSGYALNTCCIVNKGDSVYVEYNAGGTLNKFIFIYDEGEV